MSEDDEIWKEIPPSSRPSEDEEEDDSSQMLADQPPRPSLGEKSIIDNPTNSSPAEKRTSLMSGRRKSMAFSDKRASFSLNDQQTSSGLDPIEESESLPTEPDSSRMHKDSPKEEDSNLDQPVPNLEQTTSNLGHVSNPVSNFDHAASTLDQAASILEQELSREKNYGDSQDEDEINSLQQSNIPQAEEDSFSEGLKRQSKSGSVKFSEPLNIPEELENKYEELMGESKKASDLLVEEDFGEFPPELSEAQQRHPVEPQAEFENQNPVVESESSQSYSSSVDPSQSSQAHHSPEIPQQLSDHEPGEEEDQMEAGALNAADNVSPQESVLTDNMSLNPTNTTTNTVAPSAMRYSEIELASIVHSINQENYHHDHDDPFGAFEITPEDIFNEIKIARTENKDQENSQNLHSFIISKTFSSENMVVLLNLRRMKDGEWVLDKTIAQGLKPQTYGGVVSIDQYDFIDQPNNQEVSKEEQPSSRSLKQMSSRRTSDEPPVEPEKITVISPPCSKNIMDVLQKLEDYVADVNREIQEAREILKNAPLCTDDSVDATCEPPHFDELPFIEKLIKMVNVLIADEDEPCCNLCDNVETTSHTHSAISYWLRSLMQEISNFCPDMLLPKTLLDLRDIATTSSVLISQSQAIIEEVKKSGLLDKLSNTGLLSIKHSFSNTKSGTISQTVPAVADESNSTTPPTDKFHPSSLESVSKGQAPPSSESHGPIHSTSESTSALPSKGQIDSPPPSIGQIPPSSESPSKPQIMTIKMPQSKVDVDLSMDPSMAGGSLQLNIESKSDVEQFIKEHE